MRVEIQQSLGQSSPHESSPSTLSLVSESLAELLCSPESARIIGLRYLRRNPCEANIEVLFRKVLDGDVVRQVLFERPQRKIDARVIRTQIDRDFALGRMTKVEGWFLSETEARLRALFSLDCRGWQAQYGARPEDESIG